MMGRQAGHQEPLFYAFIYKVTLISLPWICGIFGPPGGIAVIR